MRSLLPLLVLSAAGCQPEAELADLIGLWGRVDNGRHEVWRLAQEIDATGLEDVRPAFLRYDYPIDQSEAQVAMGRWNIISGDLIITPVWSLNEDEANRTSTLIIDDFDSRGISLIWPGEEEPVDYITLQELPSPAQPD